MRPRLLGRNHFGRPQIRCGRDGTAVDGTRGDENSQNKEHQAILLLAGITVLRLQIDTVLKSTTTTVAMFQLITVLRFKGNTVTIVRWDMSTVFFLITLINKAVILSHQDRKTTTTTFLVHSQRWTQLPFQKSTRCHSVSPVLILWPSFLLMDLPIVVRWPDAVVLCPMCALIVTRLRVVS